MLPIFGFRYNFKDYRSTDRAILEKFAEIFSITADIQEVGLSSEVIELERVNAF